MEMKLEKLLQKLKQETLKLHLKYCLFWHWILNSNSHQTLRFWKPLRTWAPCHPLEDLRIWRIKVLLHLHIMVQTWCAVSWITLPDFCPNQTEFFKKKYIELSWFECLNSQTTAFGLENAYPFHETKDPRNRWICQAANSGFPRHHFQDMSGPGFTWKRNHQGIPYPPPIPPLPRNKALVRPY